MIHHTKSLANWLHNQRQSQAVLSDRTGDFALTSYSLLSSGIIPLLTAEVNYEMIVMERYPDASDSIPSCLILRLRVFLSMPSSLAVAMRRH